ncbi:hypothetical protein ACOME3_009570 [Neoechinorhynchus agilis]
MWFKYVVQIIYVGGQLIGRALARGVREELRRNQAQGPSIQRPAANSASRRQRVGTNQMSIEEAKKILSVDDLDPQSIQKRYDYLFRINDVAKGGSFYLQSKERLDDLLKRQELETN